MSDPLLTPEQQKYLDDQVTAALTAYRTKEAEDARYVRNWIIASPVAHANIIGWVCLVVGVVIGQVLPKLI